MSRNSSLPRYFAVEDNYEYKFYENKAYMPNQSTLINIVSNFNILTVITRSKYFQNIKVINSVVRKYSDKYDKSATWTYSGYEFLIEDTNSMLYAVPLITMMGVDSNSILPYSSESYNLEYIDEYDVSHPSKYESVDLYDQDPYPIIRSGCSRSGGCCRRVSQPQATMPQATMPQVTRPQAAMPQAAIPQVSRPQAASLPSLPAHVKNIIIADSISKKESCPITSIDIDRTNASVTSCGHVFTTEAISRWLTTSVRKECPICKQKCSI